MIAHRVVHAQELWIRGEDRCRNVIDLAADEPAHRHVQLQVHHVDFRAAEERPPVMFFSAACAHAGR